MSRALYPLELWRTHGERGHILGSFIPGTQWDVKNSHKSCTRYFSFVLGIDVVTPEWVGAKHASGWRYRENTSGSFGYNKYFSGEQSKVVNLHFISEVRPEVVRGILRSARVVSFIWGRQKYYFFQLAFRFVVTYLCPVKSRIQDCSRKVKNGWFEGLSFFNLGEQQVNVLLQNSEQSAPDCNVPGICSL